MEDIFIRTKMLVGEEALKKLSSSRVAVFGLGGVGGYVAEALVRSGVGAIDVIDNDSISPSNLNRQIFALQSTVGKKKTEAAAERLKDINPDVKITVHDTFFLPENSSQIDFSVYSYVADAIDTVAGKIEIAVLADRAGVPAISCMGAGNKLDATAFKVADIYKTSVCPLARVMRRELKLRGVKKLKTVYSEELPLTPVSFAEEQGRRITPASISFVPSVAGLIMAGEIIKDLIK